MYIVGQWGTQVGFAQALRIAFTHHKDLRWDPDESKTKIAIYDSFPRAPMVFPSIMVRVSGGHALLRGIGEEVASISTNSQSIDGTSRNVTDAITYSGNLRPTVTLQIAARSGFERAEIADWSILFLRHFATDKFAREGCLIQDVQMGAQTERLLGNDVLYETTLNVTCLTTFTREVPVSTQETINAICLTNIFCVLPDGSTHSGSPV